MNSEYFYNIKYISPLGVQMYEYSKLSDSIDFATFYHDSMYQHGLLDNSSHSLIEQYRTVPTVIKSPLGLEFDCGSKLPALFARLHPTDMTFNQEVFTALGGIVGLDTCAVPQVPRPLFIEDAGVFPERATGLLRILIRGGLSKLKEFADSNKCVNTDIISSAADPLPTTTAGLSFDWDGRTMTNFMFHSATIHTQDLWVLQATAHATKHINKLFADRQHTISRYVKVSLSPTAPSNYMKAYFTVRYTR